MLPAPPTPHHPQPGSGSFPPHPNGASPRRRRWSRSVVLVRERGGGVLLFTDTWLSPVSSRADVVLPCRVTAPSPPYDSLVPTLALIETVVAGVVETLGEAAHEHLRTAEDVAQRIGLV
ncbi:MurR/RpiR family transcriptional regulator [Streptomyces sp. NPDC047928]|uniref:MurR/RpiR family transcriptional regulator n=1 Tax=unclassified Streptomyces TaxID=2593676 RepID=UPI003714B221